jgi:hypothetical protein
METPVFVSRMFHCHQNGAPPLAADSYALRKPQDDKHYRSRYSYRFIGRQQANDECGGAHDHKRAHQHCFPP